MVPAIFLLFFLAALIFQHDFGPNEYAAALDRWSATRAQRGRTGGRNPQGRKLAGWLAGTPAHLVVWLGRSRRGQFGLALGS